MKSNCRGAEAPGTFGVGLGHGLGRACKACRGMDSADRARWPNKLKTWSRDRRFRGSFCHSGTSDIQFEHIICGNPNPRGCQPMQPLLAYGAASCCSVHPSAMQHPFLCSGAERATVPNVQNWWLKHGFAPLCIHLSDFVLNALPGLYWRSRLYGMGLQTSQKSTNSIILVTLAEQPFLKP